VHRASRIAHRTQGTRDINKIIIKIKEEERERDRQRQRQRERGREKETEEGYTLSVEHRTSYIAHCT
jgi:hypothetical protein